jgi:hypothetical protein
MPAGALQAAADPPERFDRMRYREFWPRYLAAHADRRTRALHYLGTAGAVACIAVAAIAGDWRWLVAAPLVGYGPAWLAHAAFERNRPETFSGFAVFVAVHRCIVIPYELRIFPDRVSIAVC